MGSRAQPALARVGGDEDEFLLPAVIGQGRAANVDRRELRPQTARQMGKWFPGHVTASRGQTQHGREDGPGVRPHVDAVRVLLEHHVEDEEDRTVVVGDAVVVRIGNNRCLIRRAVGRRPTRSSASAAWSLSAVIGPI